METESPPRQFAVIRDAQIDRIVVDVFGDVDIASATEFREAIEAITFGEGGPPVAIDLTKCHYFDSSGVGVLVVAHKRFGARLSVVVDAGSQVARVLQIVRFDRLFPVTLRRSKSVSVS